MLRYIGKRILKCAVTMLAVAVLIFSILWFAPEDPALCVLAKPVIYLYPEEETVVSVTLDGVELGATYPEYGEGWQVLSRPDGTLTNLRDQREYSYLFWDGQADVEFDFSQGFCVAGEDTAQFLRHALETMGLTTRELNEFIVYWLPLMEGNPYNLISFQEETYTQTARLTIAPEPDSLLRVFMAWKALEEPVDIQPQQLEGFVREGFTVVEWGGAQV